MTECVNEDDVEVELSLGLTIGSDTGKLRKCSGLDVVVKNDGVLGRQETRKKQEVRRGGAVRVDEDERVIKKAKSGFRFDCVDEGGRSFSSGDCSTLSGQPKCSSDHIALVSADGVKKQIMSSSGLLNSTSPNDENLSSSTPSGVPTNLHGQYTSKERSVVLPLVPLAKMPCVSTTGTGPGGKTVRGFLYRYTKEEVCIVCVCHGFLFSPAKFVEHAGGINVENPLRHITVTPFPTPTP